MVSYYKMMKASIVGSFLLSGLVLAHPMDLLDDPHEHEIHTLPASNANVKLIGKMRVNQDFDERVGDVAVMDDYAYLGSFAIGQKNCQKGGVYIFDISTPSTPKQISFVRIGNNSSYVGEGVQVIKMNTPYFKGNLLVAAAESCQGANSPNGGSGGLTLVDVNNPKSPKILVEGAGDFLPAGDAYTPPGIAHSAHSAFAWVHNDKAYAAIIDIGDTGIDIMDITDPRNPKMINEDFIAAKVFPSILQADSFVLKEVFAHDLTVKDINGKKIMVLSNWDSGYVVLDVTDPNPGKIKLIADSDYPAIDPLTQQHYYPFTPDLAPPTPGNGHYAELSPDNKYILATDESFGDKFISGIITASTYNNVGFEFFGQGESKTVSPGLPAVQGQTVYVGRACTGDAAVPKGNGSQIAVIERGVCLFTDKVAAVEQAGGYAAIMIMQREGADACSAPIDPSGAIGVSRDVGYQLFGIPYDDAACLDTSDGIKLAPLAVGATGATISLSAKGIIPGYTRLFEFSPTLINNTKPSKLKQLAVYTIAENLDPTSPIHMPVHEVTWSLVNPGIAYLAHYNGGVRVIKIVKENNNVTKIQEVGHFVEESNNFWGVQLWEKNGKEYFLSSDMNSGLYIFEYAPQ